MPPGELTRPRARPPRAAARRLDGLRRRARPVAAGRLAVRRGRRRAAPARALPDRDRARERAPVRLHRGAAGREPDALRGQPLDRPRRRARRGAQGHPGRRVLAPARTQRRDPHARRHDRRALRARLRGLPREPVDDPPAGRRAVGHRVVLPQRDADQRRRRRTPGTATSPARTTSARSWRCRCASASACSASSTSSPIAATRSARATSACSPRSRTRRRSCCGTRRCSPRRAPAPRASRPSTRSPARSPRRSTRSRLDRVIVSQLARVVPCDRYAVLRFDHERAPRRARGRARCADEPGARRRRPRVGASRTASTRWRCSRTARSTSPTWRTSPGSPSAAWSRRAWRAWCWCRSRSTARCRSPSLAASTRPDGFALDQIRLLETVSYHVGVALKNAELFSRLQDSYIQLNEAQDGLVRSEKLRALGEMASGVAHDFNNVLGAILGRAQLLKGKTRSKEMKAELAIIERAALDGAVDRAPAAGLHARAHGPHVPAGGAGAAGRGLPLAHARPLARRGRARRHAVRRHDRARRGPARRRPGLGAARGADQPDPERARRDAARRRAAPRHAPRRARRRGRDRGRRRRARA